MSLLFSSVEVEQRRNRIRISGIQSRYFNLAIDRYFQTQRVKKHIFTRIKRNELIIPSFYAIEFDYMLQALMQTDQRALSYKLLERIRELLYQNTWLRLVEEEHPSILDHRRLDRFYKDPLDYQRHFFELYDRNTQKYDLKGYLLAAPAGAGKTLTNLMLAEQRRSDRIFVVCPKNAIRKVWKHTIDTEYKKEKPRYEISDEVSSFSLSSRVYITHFESLSKAVEIADEFTDERVFIIIDESHHFNDPNSKRTQNLIELVNRSKASDVIWASGTPIKALGKEMIPFLKSIDKRFDSDSAERFKKIFGYESSRAIELLTNRLGLTTFKIDKSRVVSGEPLEDTIWVNFKEAHQYTLESLSQEMSAFVESRIHHYRENYQTYLDQYMQGLEIFESRIQPMDRALQREYQQYKSDVRTLQKTRNYRIHNETIQRTNRFEKDYILPKLDGRDKHQFRDAKSVIKYVELKIQGEALGEILTRRRIDAHRDMVEHTPFDSIIDSATKKTVIFTSFVEVLETIGKRLQAQGYSPLLVYGRTNNELEKIVSDFERSEKINPLIATYQSLSTAVPLVMANNCILFNQPYREYIREQATSRLYRLGQDEQVFIWNILLDTGEKPNISTRSHEIVQWSKEQVDELLRIDSDEQIEELAQSFDERNYLGQIGRWIREHGRLNMHRCELSSEHLFLSW